jgi:hypothetical protein
MTADRRLSPACLTDKSFIIAASRAGLPSFLSLPPNDFIVASKESENDFILCKWFEQTVFQVKRFGQM